MADTVQYLLEEQLPELEDFERKGRADGGTVGCKDGWACSSSMGCHQAALPARSGCVEDSTSSLHISKWAVAG